jgi:hypothetical protein
MQLTRHELAKIKETMYKIAYYGKPTDTELALMAKALCVLLQDY